MMRATALAVSVAFLTSAVHAQTTPASCVSADKARDHFLSSSGKGASLADKLDNANDEQTMRGRRLAVDEAQMLAAGRLCVGDLVAAGRMDDAFKTAARFGLLDDAERLARIMATMKSVNAATPSPQ